MKTYFNLFIALVILLPACSKEDTTKPVLQLANLELLNANNVVKPDSSVSFEVIINDDTQLKSVETYIGNIPIYKGSVTNFANGRHFEYKTPALNINKSTSIKVIATDASNNVNSIEVSFAPKISVLKQFNNVTLGGLEIDNPHFIGLESGTVYNAQQAMNNIINKELDLAYSWGYLTTSDSLRIINETGTTFAYAGFDTRLYASMYDDYFTTLYETYLTRIAVNPGDLVFFKTKNGKKGFLYFDSYDKKTDEMHFSYKIQP